MEYRNFFENLKFINIVNFFCEDRLYSGMGFWYSIQAWVYLTLFGIGYAFYTLIRVVIRIFDVVFVAEANFALVLWSSWKTNIFRFKNTTVSFITNCIVFFVFWKVFLHFLYWQLWIKISLVWCILVFIVADCWNAWVYVQVNDFCITYIWWRMTTPAIFSRCYCTIVTLTLSRHHFGYHSIWFQVCSETLIYIQLHFCNLLRGVSISWTTANHRLSVG